MAVNCRPKDPVKIIEAQTVNPITPKAEPMLVPISSGRFLPSPFQASSAPGLSLLKNQLPAMGGQGLAGTAEFIAD
jgi:hypothetical protein